MPDDNSQPTPDLSGNGAVSPSILIVLRLQQTPQGTALDIKVEPPGLYPDVVIDACLRTVRHLERTSLAAELLKAQQQAARLQREIGLIKGRG